MSNTNTSSASEQHAIRRTDEAVSTQLDADSTVVLHVGTQTYYELNVTGQVVWRYLGEHESATLSELTDALQTHVDATNKTLTHAQAQSDVQAFVQSMKDADLVEPVPPTD